MVMRSRSGLSAVELLVALVVVETALLAVLGLAVQATRILSLAARTEEATAAVYHVADSLVSLPPVVEGRVLADWGHVEWESGTGAWVSLRALSRDTLAPPLVDARIWVP